MLPLKRFPKLVFCFGVITILFTRDLISQTPLLSSEFIYEKAPFESCHASTIVETESGFIAAWFGGTNEGDKDVEIWLSRFEMGKWAPPRSVANGIQNDSVRYPCWNPVLVRLPDSSIRLFYKVGPSPRKWWGETRISTNEGENWSSPAKLPDGILGPVKNKALILSDSVIISPSSTEHDGWRVHFEHSNDGGQSWEVVSVPSKEPPLDAIQPTILRHPEGRLQAICRTQAGFLAETWSHDNGSTWSDLILISLPNPNAGIDGITLHDGRHLLVYNHSTKPPDKWGGLRTPLNISVSADGLQWEECLVLESESGEYSYPAVIQSGEGKVHITYTWNRKKIKHVILDPSYLECNPISK